MKKSFILVFTLLFFSCSDGVQDGGNKPREIKSPDSFRYLLNKFKPAELPVTIRACEINSSGCPQFEGSDSLYNPRGNVAFCSFQTNGNYFAVVSLEYTDCSIPILTTFDKNGKKIDEKFIGVGLCGSGPGFHCEEFMTIRNDFTIYTSDTISEAEIDSLGHEIKETMKKYVIFKKGKLLSSGKIELSEETKKDLYLK
jgi:hypothetical protein